MIADHTKVADMPKQLAIAKQVELSNGPSVAQKAKLKMIDGDNANFDARYAKTFGVEAHRGTIKLFQKAAANTKDPDVRRSSGEPCRVFSTIWSYERCRSVPWRGLDTRRVRDAGRRPGF
jgi:predicted outer membrane protein